MGLRINPAPASFKSPARKNIESGNKGTCLETEKLLNAGESVHSYFKEKGFYKAIRESDLYSEGNPPEEAMYIENKEWNSCLPKKIWTWCMMPYAFPS